ncbi:hypothetical protein BDZ94DRAFT_1261516 [Collybia nuda]|uniref:Uncharacterized protein n=1 Tax=Collybia nuda TaxID=64659 RepID=A0A9P5Y4V7_9AGAR|nr:hypothetical protein BDZ94DRAFT_1261516 [Collybia nuda]
MSFPTPVGGTLLQNDFAPSILFAVLYALLIPLMVYRAWDKRSRTLLLLGTAIFGIERVVIFSLRAAQSQNEDQRESKGLLTYMQVSFGMGFIGIANDLVNLVRVLLVNPTYGSDRYGECSAAIPKSDTSLSSDDSPLTRPHVGDFPGQPPDETPDHPRQRFWARRFSDFTNLSFLAAIVPGVIANSRFSSVIDDDDAAEHTTTLRYVSSGVALFLMAMLAGGASWAQVKQARVSKSGVSMMFALTFLLSVIAVYRLSVMFNTTSSITSTEPGSLNSTGAKTTFYVLHVLPEWLANTLLFGFNIRRMYGTGMFGDWRNEDETEEERKKREMKELKKAEKKRRKQDAARVTSDGPADSETSQLVPV